MKPELRTALAVTGVSMAVTSIHGLDVRLGPLYLLLNLGLMAVGLWAGTFMLGSMLLKMSAELLGLVLGLMVFARIMTARNPDNNLLPLAIAINFVVGLLALWFGTAIGDFLRRQRSRDAPSPSPTGRPSPRQGPPTSGGAA